MPRQERIIKTPSLCACGCGQLTRVVPGTKPRRYLGHHHNRGTGNPSYMHGGTGTRTFASWKSMLQRCLNPNHRNFSNYGGRGISVCDQWRESFEAFIRDMGERPDGCSLDRIDVDGHYAPENCRWATRSQQVNNRRGNVKLTLDGVTHTVEEWSRIVGIHNNTLLHRVSSGWDARAVLTTPPGRGPRKPRPRKDPCWCGRQHFARGLCHLHYSKHRREARSAQV